MGQLKKNDTIAVLKKDGTYSHTIQGPHRSLIAEPVFDGGRVVDYRYKPAPKGYGQPHEKNGNNKEIVYFGQNHRRKYWKKHRAS